VGAGGARRGPALAGGDRVTAGRGSSRGPPEPAAYPGPDGHPGRDQPGAGMAAELTDMLQTFLREGRLIHHEWLWGGDGRITAGHFAVLQERARAGSLAVTLFDSMTEPSWSWSDRDEAMGRRLLGSPARDASTLVVAGNAHTHLTPTDLGPPLGARLAQERPGVREIRINYGNGGFYNFQPRRFGPHIAGHQPRVAVEDAYSSSICPRPTRRSCRSVRASSGRGGLSPRALAPPPPRPGRPGDRRRCPARRPWC
jgi:hypothetical protein